jgi:hypothetical protein
MSFAAPFSPGAGLNCPERGETACGLLSSSGDERFSIMVGLRGDSLSGLGADSLLFEGGAGWTCLSRGAGSMRSGADLRSGLGLRGGADGLLRSTPGWTTVGSALGWNLGSALGARGVYGGAWSFPI